MDPLSADLALSETLARQAKTDATARAAMAVPLRLLALAWLGLIPVVLVVGRDHLGPYVGLALLIVTILAWFRYQRTAATRGIRTRVWPWLGVALIALAGGATASRLGTEHALTWLNVSGPFVVNAVALCALARLVRSRDLVACALAIVLAAAVAAATLNGDAAVAAQLAVDAPMLMLTSARLTRMTS